MDSIIKKRFIRLVCILNLIFMSFTSSAQDFLCGDLQNAFGPFDYTDPSIRVHESGIGDNKLHLVESAHFYEAIEDLTQGETDMQLLLHHLDYTLRVFPNHHRALYAVMRLEDELGGKIPQHHFRNVGSSYERTPDCFFDRAVRFRPNDPTVHLLRGIYYHWLNQFDKAMEAYRQSETLYPKSADLKYNLGLLFIDRAEYETARKYAKEAYDLGHTQIGLREKLTQAGYWP